MKMNLAVLLGFLLVAYFPSFADFPVSQQLGYAYSISDLRSGPNDSYGIDPAVIRDEVNVYVWKSRLGAKLDIDLLDMFLLELAEMESPRSSRDRQVLAAAWKSACEAYRIGHGESPVLVDMLRTAKSQDPEDEYLAASLAYHELRESIVEARLRAQPPFEFGQ